MIKTKNYTIDVLENGVIRTEIYPNIHFTAQIVEEINLAYKTQIDVSSGLFLNVLGEGVSNDLQLFTKFADPKRTKAKKAEAVVLSDVTHQVKSKFFQKNFKVTHKLRFFDNEVEAKQWLVKQA